MVQDSKAITDTSAARCRGGQQVLLRRRLPGPVEAGCDLKSISNPRLCNVNTKGGRFGRPFSFVQPLGSLLRCGTGPAVRSLAVAMLALQAQKVVELRLVKLAWGGAAGSRGHRMISGRSAPSIEASGTLMRAALLSWLARYRDTSLRIRSVLLLADQNCLSCSLCHGQGGACGRDLANVQYRPPSEHPQTVTA